MRGGHRLLQSTRRGYASGAANDAIIALGSNMVWGQCLLSGLDW